MSADDLLESRASINWAVAQLKPLHDRIEAWYQTRPYELVTYFDSERGKKAFKYEIRNPLPLLINAEVGAIINSIRSSLDILAVALAKRGRATDVSDVSFPVSRSLAAFQNDGVKKIKRLSAEHKAAIEALTPYKGGNDLLYALHEMDITRKHRSLLVIHHDLRFGLTGTALECEWPHELPVWDRPKDKSVLAWISANAADSKADISVEITLARPKPLQPEPVIPALAEFASLAHGIVDCFC